jgi:hypothetical protein
MHSRLYVAGGFLAVPIVYCDIRALLRQRDCKSRAPDRGWNL